MSLFKRSWEVCLSYKIALYFQYKKMWGGQKNLSVYTFLFDNLRVLTPSHPSPRAPLSPPITMIWSSTSFHQAHIVIIQFNFNFFQSLSSFPNLNPNSDMASCDLIKMSPIFFSYSRKIQRGRGGYGFPDSSKGRGRIGNFALQNGFTDQREPDDEWFWPIKPFSKLKITFCEY